MFTIWTNPKQAKQGVFITLHAGGNYHYLWDYKTYSIILWVGINRAYFTSQYFDRLKVERKDFRRN